MKDNREINNGIRTLVTNDNPKARVLGVDPKTLDADLDEVAGMYSQEQLDGMVTSGVLSGDWTSTLKGEKNTSKAGDASGSPFPEDYPGFDVLGAVEGMTREKLEAMSDEEITAINGIGPATLKQIRAYGNK